jgi:predicted cobalt transporter CbtA
MPAGDLVARQVWWVGTIAATAAGIYLIATRAEAWALAIAILLIGLPHIIGAPAAVHGESAVPPGLAASFAANAIAANAVFWLLIGQLLGLALNRTAKDLYAT